MTAFEQKSLIEMVLYILNKTGGIDFYHVFKIIYFAEMKHLAKWGIRLQKDDLCALEYGPVPSKLYDAVKRKNAPGTQLSSMLFEVADFAGNDAPNVLLPKRQADMDYISKSEQEALDTSIAENASLTFSELKEKSHDAAWKEAYEKPTGLRIISPVSMAKVAGLDENALEYINEQMELEKALA